MRKYVPYLVILGFTILLFLFLFIFKSDSIRLTEENPKSLNTGWTYEQTTPIDLPAEMNVPVGEFYQISKTLDGDFEQSQTLLIRSSLQEIFVYLEGQLIYKKEFQRESTLPPYASMWHFVNLPQHSEGALLTIEFQSPYEQMSGDINPIYYGTDAQLYAKLISDYGFRLFVTLLVGISGFFIIILNFIRIKTLKQSLVYLGAFLVLASLWMLAETRMIQFITSSQMLVGSLAYFMLPSMALPLLYYMKKEVLKGYKRLYNGLIAYFYGLLILVFSLHIFGVADFFETVELSQVSLLLGFVIIIITMSAEIKQYKDKQTIKTLKMISILMLFGIIEMINFLTSNFQTTSIFLEIGIIIVFIYMMYDVIQYVIERMRLSYEAEIYERLAYQDQLTGGFNRFAFERDFEKFFTEKKDLGSLKLIYFDLDNLKGVNDRFGHLEGDRLILDGFETICDIFHQKGTCYRIGGDEFACLVTNTNDNEFKHLFDELNQQVKDKNIQSLYKLNISYGYSTYTEEDKKPSDMIKRADYEMYQNKDLKRVETSK